MLKTKEYYKILHFLKVESVDRIYPVEEYFYEIDEETGEKVVIPWLEGTKMGNYLKSVHYADEAIGELINHLEEKGLLEDTIIVLYGDHDCKLKQSEFKKLYESEYYEGVLINPENTIKALYSDLVK